MISICLFLIILLPPGGKCVSDVSLTACAALLLYAVSAGLMPAISMMLFYENLLCHRAARLEHYPCHIHSGLGVKGYGSAACG